MPRVSAQQGFSLIEVLVAVLVIAIGLLGVAGMQLVGLKGNQQSFSKNQAAHHAQAILERMRGNPAAVISDDYLFDSSAYNCAVEPAKNCGEASAVCTPAQIASHDLFRAYCGRKGGTVGGIKGDLSNATMSISCPVDCDTGVALSLGWDEQLLGSEGKKSGVKTITRELTINTVIGE